MKHIILGTAGHIDHGKTSLIEALTGTNTDRLPEEKARGITIELGFAHLTLQDIHFGVVDVPGHEKFIHHMVAGVGGIDLVLLVIAADEGVMPQTREHVAICDVLGVKTGLVALTKTDMVDDDWMQLVQEDISGFLSNTFLDKAPIIPVSSRTGAGLDRLCGALSAIASVIPEKSQGGIFRLPADRVFSIHGFGTVVTGTVISGSIKTGEMISIVPGGPDSKIRGLQVHGQKVPEIRAGQRAAINLQGIDREAVQRGMVVAPQGFLQVSYMIDADLTLLKSITKPLRNRTQIRFYCGTSELIGRVLLLDREELLPGERCPVQIRFGDPLAALTGDRFLIRSYSPMFTIGGGVILDAEPRKHRRYQPSILNHLQILRSDRTVDHLITWIEIAGIAGVTSPELKRKFPDKYEEVTSIIHDLKEKREVIEINSSPKRYIYSSSWVQFKNQIITTIEAYHQKFKLKPWMAREELRTTLEPAPDPLLLTPAINELVKENIIIDNGQAVRMQNFLPQLNDSQSQLKSNVTNLVISVGASGIKTEEITEQFPNDSADVMQIVQHLLDTGAVIRLPGGLIFSAQIIAEVKDNIVSFIRKEGSISVAQFRDTVGIARKQAVPLLEHFDRVGLTRRVQDHRVLKE